jgi:hypothetical protein
MMGYGLKRCLACRDLGHWDSTGRCPPCFAEHKAKYRDPEYKADRARFAEMIKRGTALDCRRCGEPIEPGQPWQLGHGEGNEPEHRRCNEGGRTAHYVMHSLDDS